jgi:hypothetical protein
MEKHFSAIQVDVVQVADSDGFFVNATENPVSDSCEKIALVDVLSLLRKNISYKPDAKFETLDELIDNIKKIAIQIKEIRDFSQIYLVTKSFTFNQDIGYNDVCKIILWSFCKAIPEWVGRIKLVLVNGINSNDKEADDRALFILYNEFLKTTESQVVILSYDNFKSLKSHFLNTVTLNFFNMEYVTENWYNSQIFLCHKASFRQDKKITGTPSSYNVLCPINNKTSRIFIT